MIGRANKPSPQLRKHLLVQQGAAYRAAVSEAMRTVQHNLQPDALTRTAINYAGKQVWPGEFAIVGQALRKEGTLAALMPVLIPVAKGGWSWLKRRPMRRTLLRSLAIAVPAAALAYLAFKKIGAQANAEAMANDSSNKKPRNER